MLVAPVYLQALPRLPSLPETPCAPTSGGVKQWLRSSLATRTQRQHTHQACVKRARASQLIPGATGAAPEAACSEPAPGSESDIAPHIPPPSHQLKLGRTHPLMNTVHKNTHRDMQIIRSEYEESCRKSENKAKGGQPRNTLSATPSTTEAGDNRAVRWSGDANDRTKIIMAPQNTRSRPQHAYLQPRSASAGQVS